MAIYRGAGGAGDAVNDSSSEASAAVIAQAAAEAAAVAAEAAKVAAQLAETNAEAAETNAETAETNAETAASNALTSANNASNSAVSAASSASAASSSASSASTSATNAANSSTTAAGSASAAAISATAASNSASSASGYATTASNAATSASASAASATASEANALTSKNAAATSATNAASSASTANSAATTATTQAGIATTQATNASNSASAAATSATNASNSASAAATSASNAATSATSAQSAQAAAESARDATLTAYDNFDDRYLGSKTADPSVDNDGNALVAGTLYFNSVDGVMKLWTGSIWTAAYVSGAGVLLQANNLSDLNNAASARTNLGLGTAATTAATDYATAAQGAKADTALQPAAIGVTVQGYDADTAKLDVSQSWSAAQSFNAGVTLGDASGDALTINSSAVSIPNGLNFDSNTLVIDATNNYVGIGIAAPSAPLSFASATGQKIRFYNSVSGYGIGVEASEFRFVTDSSAVFTWGTGTYASPTERMRISAAGNLMIGNTSYAQRLSVAKQSDGIIGYFRRDGATINPALTINANETGNTVGFSTDYAGATSPAMTFTTQATERMRIDSSGNVGIGTNSPIYPLQVGSYTGSTTTVLAVGSTTEGRLSFGDGTSGVDANAGGLRYFHSSDAMALYTAATERMRIDSSGNLGLGVTPSAWAGTAGKALQINNLTIGQNIGFDVSVLTTNGYATSGTAYNYIGTAAAAQYRLGSGGHIWYTAPSGTAGNAITFTQAMTLNASGNLGIGTSSPSTKLDTVGTYRLQLRTDDAVPELRALTANGSAFKELGLNGLDLRFIISNTERMRLDSSGNLGLGVTPSAWDTIKPIEIARAGNFVGGSGSASAVYLGANTRFSSSSWRYANNGAAALYTVEDNTHFWRNAASGTAGNAITFTQAMTLNASGNLGVGTTTIGSGLSFGGRYVGNNGYANAIRVYDEGAASNSQSSNSYGFGFISDGALSYTAGTGGYHAFFTANTERMRIDSSGNLLVGTTSAGTGKIHLAVPSGGAWYSAKTGALSDVLFGADGSGNAAIYTTGSTHTIALYTSGSERFRIGSSGQLGIGGANYGTSGQVLTSNGSGSAPSWAAVSASGLGVGQSWASITPTSGTTYTNSTGKPIFIYYNAQASGSMNIVVVVNGVTIHSNSSGYSQTAAFIVPNGQTWNLTYTNYSNLKISQLS